MFVSVAGAVSVHVYCSGGWNALVKWKTQTESPGFRALGLGFKL